MKFEDFKGMPSGKDYGTVVQWSLLDGGDFVVGFFVEGNPFEDISKSKFAWVVEDKYGNVVYFSDHRPSFQPIFGLDEREWVSFKHYVLPIVDAYIEEMKAQ